jgi:APA family basic amino acid/polyamine antiporter
LRVKSEEMHMAELTQPTSGGEDVFLRKASGVIRAISPADGMFYGYLSSAGIYALIFYLFLGAGAFPHANYLLANVLSFVFFVPVFAVYSMLASSMPRSGGDYVFISRIISPATGFVVVWFGYIVWQFFFCFFAASAIINAVFAPMFDMIGVSTGNHWWIHAGTWVQHGYVRVPLVVLLVLLSGYVMSRGMGWFLKLQKYFMMPAAILGLLMIIGSLLFVSKGTFFAHFDHFQRSVGGLTSSQIMAKAPHLGYSTHGGSSSLLDTLAFSVNLSYLYMWAMWSTELFGEVKSARRVRSVFGMFFGAEVLMFITYLVGISWAYHYVGEKFMHVFSWMVLNQPDALGGNWGFRGAPTFFYLPTLNLVFGIVLFICFIGPISQSLFNTILSVSRFGLAMSLDRVLPAKVGAVNRYGAPYYAIWGGVIISAALAIGAEFITTLQEIVFWGSVCSLFAVAVVAFAGMILPFRRRALFAVSPTAQSKLGPVPWITVLGLIGGAFVLGSVILTLADNSAFGLWNSGAARIGLYAVVLTIVGSIAWYNVAKVYRAREGIMVDRAFAELPPD